MTEETTSQEKAPAPAAKSAPVAEKAPEAASVPSKKAAKKAVKQEKKTKKKALLPEGWVAIIRVRGMVNMHYDMTKTLDLLRLQRGNVLVLHKNSKALRGMLQKVKDFVTFGMIDDVTLKALVEKRGEAYVNPGIDARGKHKHEKFITIDGKKWKPFFRLHPPKGGFERKGIKQPYSKGGVLGDRKDKIGLLINKML